MAADWAPVREWHRAVNERDVSAARAVAAEAIVMAGPKGETAGVASFVEWIEHSGIHLRPVSWHPVDDSNVVVVQDATWPRHPQADPEAAPIRMATLFRLQDDRVTAVLRYDGLDAALAAADGPDAGLDGPPSNGS
ncbi:nuclear transport factor 2 family protein [Streptomyces ovatisporus]|uniref:Nuclear transport factor 2 family protein n=1 Tax=Streptomyces ovatisporus TaxID=1128682 RepID=A0ABV9ABC2_9ACTN